jgi:signal transduction histidine kinase
VGSLANAKSLENACDLPPGSGYVRTDPDKLRQILVNLLSNSVKFTAPGGRVTVCCSERGDFVAIDVEDTGKGIPADKLDAVFEPFVQLDNGLTRTTEGTGLGLAISRGLARGMGADITVRSEIDAGSVFTLTLPRSPARGTPTERQRGVLP